MPGEEIFDMCVFFNIFVYTVSPRNTHQSNFYQKRIEKEFW